MRFDFNRLAEPRVLGHAGHAGHKPENPQIEMAQAPEKPVVTGFFDATGHAGHAGHAETTIDANNTADYACVCVRSKLDDYLQAIGETNPVTIAAFYRQVECCPDALAFFLEQSAKAKRGELRV